MCFLPPATAKVVGTVFAVSLFSCLVLNSKNHAKLRKNIGFTTKDEQQFENACYLQFSSKKILILPSFQYPTRATLKFGLALELELHNENFATM